jgi:hypothetical protein
MPRFFNRIRKKLAKENKFFQYFRYAIGEILLVVIGILIALQIDNWNEWRKERVKEQEVLSELKENLQRNIEDLNDTMEQARRFNASRTITFSALENNLPYHDSLAVHFLFAGLTITKPTISRSGYEMLQNQGYDIITSIKLRKEIVQLFEGTYATYERKLSSGNVDPLVEDMTRYFRKYFKLVNSPPYRRVPLDYSELIRDNYLIQCLKAIAAWERVLIQDNSQSLEETKSVLGKIKLKLGE